MVSRRSLLLSSAALAGAAVIARPGDRGGPYDDYFARLNQTLRSNAIDRPVLVIDLDRLDRNIDRVVQSAAIAPARTYRVVVKSLPSPQLVDYVARRANTQALMCFHRPFIEAMAQLRPQADILLGKPMPVSAARHFYASQQGPFDPARQLQWLIDTEARLAQYLEMAKQLGLKLRINLEIDVGLRRGGFASPEALHGVLSSIRDNPQHLEYAGFMGYDAHLMGLPGFLARRELPQVKARYAACKDYLQAQFPQLLSDHLCFNGAGSPTFRYYDGDALLNDISAGSCLMKPTHYDLPILDDFEPSAFIASPVLKRLQGGRLPAMDGLGPVLRAWNPNQAQIYFAYGGNWLAEPESPPGLQPNFAYISSNQQGYNASDAVNIGVDDFIFLRPTQSEAVLLQFGDLLAVRGDQIEARWPVLPAGI
ncbi:alanine racemase [Pseudomonas sp. N040]|uniref:alanine racemase n=1 Tax=Pseudomonas sp. N040 TaxID=2785325 RepID=UPI0018A31252|nr:alanine racemase [Pseudomonas sp. N040]MBF7729142.1 alanine racemase [Pseudomonas sp. N040]MBW7012782.1 alanine racemase [Pseudomonas sp. N040]